MNTAVLGTLASKHSSGPWLEGYSYRKEITITGSVGAGTNFQVPILIGETSGATGEHFDLGGHAQSFPCIGDSGDIRFTAADGETLLYFWVESVTGTTPNRLATVYVKVSASLESNATIYCYYGNADATNVNDGANTFIWWDNNEIPGEGAVKISDINSPEGFCSTGSYWYYAQQVSPTRIHEIDPSDGGATGEYFDFAAGVATHISSLVWDGSYLWCVDYDTDKVFKVDLATSLTNKVAEIEGSFSVGGGAGFSGHPSGMAFVTYNGASQLLITEWAGSGGAIIIVDQASALTDGTVADNIYRAYKWGDTGVDSGRIQGMCNVGSDDLYIVCQEYPDHNSYLRRFSYGDFVNIDAATDLSGSDYYYDENIFEWDSVLAEQPLIHNNLIYYVEETGNDIEVIAPAAPNVKAGWTAIMGSVFTPSYDYAYEGYYSAKLTVAKNTMYNTVSGGACILEMNVLAESTDEHIYVAVAKASNLGDRLTIGVYGNANWHRWTGGMWADTGVAISTGSWQKFQFIANGSGNIICNIDGSEAYSGSRCDQINYVSYETKSDYGSDNVYVDCIRVRKYLATPPAFSSAGSEEAA